jgi:hypothetical protein
MASTGLGAQFVEAAAEWGLDEVTLEDAVFAYRRRYLTPEEIDRVRGDDANYLRCSKAVLDWMRPGRWDRW